MANIVVVETNKRIDVDFGDYYGTSPLVDFKCTSYKQASLASVNHGDSFVIDTVNGIVPTDIDHLYTLLAQLME